MPGNDRKTLYINNNITDMKKHFTFLLAAVAIAMGCLLTSCKGDKTENNNGTDEGVYNAYVLNEGIWGGNNASLSLLNTTNGAIKNNYFAEKNGRGLGDQAQDIAVYGSKMYVTVTESKMLEIINPATGASISQITLSGKPRSIACHNGKVYVSCYDKTVVKIDTASLQLEGLCQLSGLKPEQMAVSGDKLYVVSSYEMDADGNPVYDSTLCIVSLTTFTETGKITVGLNPVRVKALSDGRLLVSYNGNYGSVPAGAVIVTPSTNDIAPLPVALGNFTVKGSTIYGYTTTYDEHWNQQTQLYQVDAATLQATRILEGYEADLTNAYGIDMDAAGNLYICNSTSTGMADIYCFNPSLVRRWKAEAGQYASHVVFF